MTLQRTVVYTTTVPFSIFFFFWKFCVYNSVCSGFECTIWMTGMYYMADILLINCLTLLRV